MLSYKDGHHHQGYRRYQLYQDVDGRTSSVLAGVTHRVTSHSRRMNGCLLQTLRLYVFFSIIPCPSTIVQE